MFAYRSYSALFAKTSHPTHMSPTTRKSNQQLLLWAGLLLLACLLSSLTM